MKKLSILALLVLTGCGIWPCDKPEVQKNGQEVSQESAKSK